MNQEKEEFLGIFWLEEIHGSSFFNISTEPCTLYFTTKRIIVDERRSVSDRLLMSTQVMFSGQRGSTIYIHSRANARDRLKWAQVLPDMILANNPNNYEVSYDDISAIVIRRTGIYMFCDDLNKPKYGFHLSTKSSLMELQQFLRSEPVLSSKV